MRIVEYGHIKPKEIKCNHCGAILEYVPSDLGSFSKDTCYIRCPICKDLILRDNDGRPLTRRNNNG